MDHVDMIINNIDAVNLICFISIDINLFTINNINEEYENLVILGSLTQLRFVLWFQ